MMSNGLRALSPRLADAWDRASSRERRLLVIASMVVATAVGWAWIWQPLLLDIARMQRDQPREHAVLAAARAQVDGIGSLRQAGGSARTGDPRAAVERVLAERGLRAAATTLDVQDGRLRLVFAAVRFDALVGALDALAKADGLRPVALVLSGRVEPGTVRAEMSLAR